MSKFVLFIALAIFHSSLGMAEERQVQRQQVQQQAQGDYHFLGFSLAYPPAKNSAVDLADEAALRFYQENRTAADCAQAEREATMNLNSMYGPETGVLTAEEVNTANLDAMSIINTVGLLTGEFKIHFHRARPFNDYPGLTPCISKPWDSYGGIKMSYPSSYASISTVLQAMLIKRFPEKRESIEKQTTTLCFDRILGGVHHPSDIEAGLALGRQIVERFGY